jgi:hypothetical protein
VLAGVTTVAFGTRVALARPTEPTLNVELTIRGCTDELATEVRRMIALDLGESSIAAGSEAPRSGERDQLEITCNARAVQVRAESAPRPPVDNELDLDAFPKDAVARAMALAAIEALSAASPIFLEHVQAERARRAAPRSAPSSEQRAPQEDHPKTQPPPRRVWLGVAPAARRFGARPQLLALGGQVDLTLRPSEALSVGIDIEIALAHRRSALGELDARLLSSSLWAGPSLRRDDFSVALVAGARAGVASLSGVATSTNVRAHTASKPWAGPLLAIRMDQAWGAFAAGLSLEAGLTLVGAEGLVDQQTQLSIGGAWLSAALGAKIAF